MINFTTIKEQVKLKELNQNQKFLAILQINKQENINNMKLI